MKNKSHSLILLPSIALFLSACAGGETSSSTDTTDGQPIALSAENWQSASLIQQDNPIDTSLEIVGSELTITVSSDDISRGDHLQIYINSDNNTETGFQFENQAWESSGVDYLIEDGDLFESTGDSTGWNWNTDVGTIDYTLNDDTANATIDLSLLGDICSNLKIGVMTRDETWGIDTFSPASSQMQTFSVSYCNTGAEDTTKPTITLLGANPLYLAINESYVDPGATASDNIDGDITSNIISEITDTSEAGTYYLAYTVRDNAGNLTSVTRTLIVSDETTTQDAIVVDGNTSDWIDIPNFISSSDGTMKVTDDAEKLYVLVTSSSIGGNVQILLDTDNSTATGFDLSSLIDTWTGGADYMIENNSLDQSKSNTAWSWDYGIATIEFIKTTDTLEIAIKKSDLSNLTDSIPMAFISSNANWNVKFLLPELSIPSYTLKFPYGTTTANNAPDAVEDSVSIDFDRTTTVKVLANDTDPDGDVLTVLSIIQPSAGFARLNTNGSIFFNPENTIGSMSIGYTISDGRGGTDFAVLTVSSTNPNDGNDAYPDITNEYVTTSKNTSIFIDVLANDSDADGDTLILDEVDQGENGATVKVNGGVRYTPDTGFVGTDIFYYGVHDGFGHNGSGFVEITITE